MLDEKDRTALATLGTYAVLACLGLLLLALVCGMAVKIFLWVA